MLIRGEIMDNQEYNSVPEMVAEAIFRTQKYLKSMKKVLRLMKRNRPVEEVRAALNEALGIVGGENNMDNINFILTYEQAKDICEHYEGWSEGDDCFGCKHYRHGDDLMGICKCEKNRLK